MYVVKVFHGYITKDGRRTRDKTPTKLLVFYNKQESENFANKIGGRVKKLEEITKAWAFLLQKKLKSFLFL